MKPLRRESAASLHGVLHLKTNNLCRVNISSTHPFHNYPPYTTLLWMVKLPPTHTCNLPPGWCFHKATHTHICPRITTARWKVETTQVFSTASMVLTSLACWALMGSAYCNRAWNWLFFVNVIIFKTVPNLEKICKIIFAHFVTPSPELSIVFTFHIIRSKNNCPVSL